MSELTLGNGKPYYHKGSRSPFQLPFPFKRDTLEEIGKNRCQRGDVRLALDEESFHSNQLEKAKGEW